MKKYDEVTGLYVEMDNSRTPEFWIVSNDGRYAHSFHATRLQAREALLKNGLRATHYIHRVN